MKGCVLNYSVWLRHNATRSFEKMRSVFAGGKVFSVRPFDLGGHENGVFDRSVVELHEAQLACQAARTSHDIVANRLKRTVDQLDRVGETLPDETATEYSMMQEAWLNASIAHVVSGERLQSAIEAVEIAAASTRQSVFDSSDRPSDAANDSEWQPGYKEAA